MTPEKKAIRLKYLRTCLAELFESQESLTVLKNHRIWKIELGYKNAIRKIELRRDKTKAKIFRLENKG